MGLSFSIENDLATVIGEGTFSVQQVLQTFSEIRAEIEHITLLRVLIVDRASEFEPSHDEIQELARGWAEIFRDVPVRIALLVERDIHYGLGRMVSVYAAQHNLPFEVFRHSLDALQWLTHGEAENCAQV